MHSPRLKKLRKLRVSTDARQRTLYRLPCCSRPCKPSLHKTHAAHTTNAAHTNNPRTRRTTPARTRTSWKPSRDLLVKYGYKSRQSKRHRRSSCDLQFMIYHHPSPYNLSSTASTYNLRQTNNSHTLLTRKTQSTRTQRARHKHTHIDHSLPPNRDIPPATYSQEALQQTHNKHTTDSLVYLNIVYG
jgi:hypothetical protein